MLDNGTCWTRSCAQASGDLLGDAKIKCRVDAVGVAVAVAGARVGDGIGRLFVGVGGTVAVAVLVGATNTGGIWLGGGGTRRAGVAHAASEITPIRFIVIRDKVVTIFTLL